MTTQQQNDDGSWSEAKPVPYYPSWWERLTHLLGKHHFYEADHCLLCNKPRI